MFNSYFYRLINGADDETPIRVVDPDDTSDSPRIILNSVVTKVERGGTAQNPWVKVTAGTKFSHFELNFVAKNLKSRGGKFTKWRHRKKFIQRLS